MNRVYEYTGLPEEREARLPTDSVFKNFTITIPRAMLARLGSSKQVLKKVVGHDGIRVVKMEGNHEEVVLKQLHKDSASLVAMDGKSLADLAPDVKQLRQCSRWHRLTRVNNAHKTAVEMADELCSGNSFELALEIKSGWLADGAKIEVQNLRVGYGDLPRDVLKGVSFTVPRRSKAAIGWIFLLTQRRRCIAQLL